MLGTGSFALPTFLALHQTAHQIVGLLTQPDRMGRGHHHHRNVMKQAALQRNIPVIQPENVNAGEVLETLNSLSTHLFVVAAYGQIFTKKFLEIPELGTINLHASLLPKYRGASPVQHAILNGETETGITIFQVESKLDTGPILAVEKTTIGRRETAGELEERLAAIAVPLTLKIIAQLEAGTSQPVSQLSEVVTSARRLKKSDGGIDWRKSAQKIDCHVRAMQPWPKAFTYLCRSDQSTMRLIVLDVEPVDMNSDGNDANAEVGSVLVADGKRLIVRTGSGLAEITRLQPDGKRALKTSEFLQGYTVRSGDRMSHDVGG